MGWLEFFAICLGLLILDNMWGNWCRTRLRKK